MTEPTSPTTPLHEPVSPTKYPALSQGELLDELAAVIGRLTGYYTDLSQAKIAYQWIYHQGYAASHETSHAAKDVHGRQAALNIAEDEISLEANISSALVLRDLLVTLLDHARREQA